MQAVSLQGCVKGAGSWLVGEEGGPGSRGQEDVETEEEVGPVALSS